MSCDEHLQARVAWEAKPALRQVYTHLFRAILAQTVPGSVLEVGGGAGRFKEFCPTAVVSDLVPSPYVDLVADAQHLPVKDESFDNIALFDVLHHIPVPKLFLAEAMRVLRPNGRLVMMEPAVTPGSYLFYRCFHPEPLDLSADPLSADALSTDEPYDSNQAIPVLLATKHRQRLQDEFPGLRLQRRLWLSFAAYPLSGGLRPWSMLSGGGARRLLELEDRLPQAIARLLAFRILLVFTKVSTA